MSWGDLNADCAAPMALCPACEAPLIATFAFSKAEFYCLECGGHYGWLAPTPGEPSPELDARYEALRSEWEQLGGPNLLGGGAMLKSCATCSTGEPHLQHATKAEREAHEAALHALAARAGRRRG